MSNNIHSICVFCGSNPGARLEYAEAARAMGRLMAKENISLVFGGGSVGLMGTIADEVLACDGRVIGVIPSGLATKEIAHAGLTEQHVVDTMHERKRLMSDRSDAFIAMPGGMGTYEEFCEVLTWNQLGIHTKPCGLLNVRGFYDHFVRFLDHAVEERFLRREHRDIMVVDSDPAGLLTKLRDWRAPTVEKWMDRRET
jgi:uncharacterized protein (TIGR00730 family)